MCNCTRTALNKVQNVLLLQMNYKLCSTERHSTRGHWPNHSSWTVERHLYIAICAVQMVLNRILTSVKRSTSIVKLRSELGIVEYWRRQTASILHKSRFEHPVFVNLPRSVVIFVEIFLWSCLL